MIKTRHGWVLFLIVAVSNQTMEWVSAQCSLCNQCPNPSGASCEPYCGPEYYTQWGQYGTQYGARFRDRAKPRCVADGSCIPNQATWGYYTQQWRLWPVTAGVTKPSGVRTRPKLPPYDTPPMEQEDRRTPSAAAPMVLPQGPGMIPERQESEEVPEMPDVPVPESPLPLKPPTTNEQTSTGPEGNGPPALPAGLLSLRRRMARPGTPSLTTGQAGADRVSGMARLPSLQGVSPEQVAHPVRSASVVIAADGRAVDEENRVQRAIHFEPAGQK
ncbi:MAG: hypothetical protein JW829_17495 [Pirellulales bacterium]|nr:hypothetical protein [Pirellulales bacterium]